MEIYYPTSMNNSGMNGSNVHLFNKAYFDSIVPKYQVPVYTGTPGDLFRDCNGPGFPPYAISVGKPSVAPRVPPLSYQRVSRPCNERFRERKTAGEIVMSDMTAHSCLLSLDTPGFTITSLEDGPYRSFSLGIAEGFQSLDNPPTWWGSFVDPWGGAFHGVGSVFYKRGILTYSNARDYPLESLATLVKDKLDLEVDGGLVQQVHAEANSGTMDLLTEFAELPEALRWIYDSFKKARAICNDFKRKDFALNERTRKRQKTIRERMSVLSEMLSRDSLTERQKEHFNREQKKLGQDLTYSIYELGQKTSSLWLQFRYALMPIIYSIKDACKLTFKQKLFRKFRKRDVQDVEIENFGDWTFEGTATLTRRCIIKRAFAGAVNIWGLLKREFAPNVLKTLWEVTRLSFVVDWFVSIGDAITASFVSNQAFLQEGSCYSTKLAVNGRFVNKSTNGVIKVVADLYDRIRINPSDYTGLYFKVDMGWRRQLDALALFVWPAVRRTFK